MLFMATFDYVIKEERVHARPAGFLVKEAANYTSSISILKDGKTADAKKIFGIMGFGLKAGDTVTFKIDGEDEEKAAAALEELIKTIW